MTRSSLGFVSSHDSLVPHDENLICVFDQDSKFTTAEDVTREDIRVHKWNWSVDLAFTHAMLLVANADSFGRALTTGPTLVITLFVQSLYVFLPLVGFSDPH